jgi:hypothetical protein
MDSGLISGTEHASDQNPPTTGNGGATRAPSRYPPTQSDAASKQLAAAAASKNVAPAAKPDRAAADRDGGESSPQPAEQIAGLSALKGLLLYAAVGAFGTLYVYFIVRILEAKAGVAPTFGTALVTAAAALAGVLGSAFALEIGTATDTRDTNPALSNARAKENPGRAKRAASWVWRALSLEPPDTESASWPKTLGIWVYAVVGSAVAITYVTNQSETPSTIKAVAVAFAGYVLALVTKAYGVKAKGGKEG